MIEFREIPKTNIVEFTIDGSISGAEFDELIAKIEAAIRQHGTLRILEHVRSFGGVPLSKYWDDIKFGLKNMKNFSHAAVVADRKWIELFTRAAKPFISAEVRYFREEEIEQAREWLRSRPAGTTPHAG